jgi:uncharacterized protein YjbI with pentapeptide repeats
MQMNDADVRVLRDRWKAGKYKDALDAITSALPEDAWVPLCESVPHTVDGSPTLDLRGAELVGGKLKNMELGGSHFGFAVFDSTHFEEVGFQYAVLEGTSFRGCEFLEAQMIPVYGDCTDFRHALFRKSFIDYAKLTNADFSGATMSDGSVDFSELTSCNFSGLLAERNEWRWNTTTSCDFVAARFVGCELTVTRFDRARLINATFDNCDLSGVDFRGADLTGVRFLGGTFGDVQQGQTTYRTRFDDTPEARRVVAASTTENRQAVEWCPVVVGSNVPTLEAPPAKLKGWPGEVVPQSGWWVSPALGSEHGRRYFKAGEKFPDIKSTDWGLVIWTYNSPD